jgi:hypothetical protein
MDSTHIRRLEESLEKNTVQKILKAENERIGKDKESMTEQRDQRELLWFQTGGALNFITAAPHCGEILYCDKTGVWINFSRHSPNCRVVKYFYSPSQKTTGQKFRNTCSQ